MLIADFGAWSAGFLAANYSDERTELTDRLLFKTYKSHLELAVEFAKKTNNTRQEGYTELLSFKESLVLYGVLTQ
ncbi:MAG: hypothetical protein ACRCXZ_09975, partial [Patescibacteria group bacterium]